MSLLPLSRIRYAAFPLSKTCRRTSHLIRRPPMSIAEIQRPYHVALSFAGEDRAYVEQVALFLQRSGLRIFYDDYEKVSLWGKDLYVHLNDVYRNQAHYTVLFASRHYVNKLWTNHERRAAQERAFHENREYILPARFDDTPIPGLPSTVGYIDLRSVSPGELAGLIAEKVRGVESQSDRWSRPTNVFIMHAARRGMVNLRYTVAHRRRFREIVDALPTESQERAYFENDVELHRSFPTPRFNCWGVPSAAMPSFTRTQIGDLVLFVGTLGEGAMIEYLGVVRAKCPFQCHDSSRLLWPEAEEDKLYPLLFFFDTEVGQLTWDQFCDDIGLPGFNPRGWYRRIGTERFNSFGGPSGYLRYLRTTCGFAALAQDRIVDGKVLQLSS